MSRRRTSRLALFVALAGLGSVLVAAPSGYAAPGTDRVDAVERKTDGLLGKLHPKLRKQVDEGATKKIHVFATVVGDAAEARELLAGDRLASTGGSGLVVGTIPVQALPKLAGAAGVVSVQPVELTQTGRPLGDPDPDAHKDLTEAEQRAAREKAQADEVPYPQAPPPKESNFEDMKNLDVLDARTHNFTGAWEAGFTGKGVTVGVLDGGTDFGHPDLLNTWQVWKNQTGARAGWNGWPKAFDPFGTLQWLVAPDQVSQGLSWYVETSEATCTTAPTCQVEFGTKTGPSRSFNAPPGTKVHTYSFPAAWSKSGNVRLTSHPDDYLLAAYGERPAVLVTDKNTAGVYDTVYVDLDGDYRFGDEKPVTKRSPAAYRDMNGDGYTDLSGGLLYYISDGVTPIPGGLDAFGVDDTSYGPGELLAWSGDFDTGIGGHGTLTASNIVGQGVVNGKAPKFDDLPGDGTYPGAVVGGAPDAKLTPYGDIYFSFEFSTQFGYYLSTRRGVDVTSNSYGSSSTDNDGWDASSQEADVIHDGQGTTPLFSTGNGAPGFGTTAPPSPSNGIAVGASTQFGGTGWDSIRRTDQMPDDDVMVWSNRGFGANATNGVDVVADGAYSSGDATLNTVLDGRNAWETWGGTSRSAPVAAGATALVYQAYGKKHGSTPNGFYGTAKEILKSSAQDLGYDANVQGSGSVDAGKAVRIATGKHAKVSPSEWRVGDYRGEEYPVFAHVTEPGGTDSQRFDLTGSGTWKVDSRRLVQTATEKLKFSSADVSEESEPNFNAPDYLVDLTTKVRKHSDADLMVVRLNYPRAQFDGNGDYTEDQAWRLLTYDWTDVNGNGRLWRDKDGDRTVDHANLDTSSNIDGNPDIDFANSEMEQGEYVRFMYHRAGSNALQSFVRDPHKRMSDGLFLGLQHTVRNEDIPVTDFEVEIDFYENQKWSWLSAPKRAGGSFTASVEVPEDTPYGMYSGSVVLSRGHDSMVVPVSVAVAAKVTQDEDGKITGAVDLGGGDVAKAQRNSLYNNGSVFGANDWGWRPESGDWRFFPVDVPKEPAEGTKLLANTTWQGTAPHTDIDTLIMGRSENQFQVVPESVYGAPYVIDTVGKSPNTNVKAGVWRFDTATGGASDVVAAPAQEGLHQVALHQVGWQGDAFDTPFATQLGSASVTPSSVGISTDGDSGGFDVTFESSVPLDGLAASAYGLSQPSSSTQQAQQDEPDDPSSASVKENVTVENASRLTVETKLASDDLDLFVLRDANGDGEFTANEIVGSSTTSSSNESVELVGPPDGEYQVWVHGYSVAGTPEFTLNVDALQGSDLTVTGVPSGELPAGTPVTLHVEYDKPMTAGEDYFGELLLGPKSAPTAMSVPIKITRT